MQAPGDCRSFRTPPGLDTFTPDAGVLCAHPVAACAICFLHMWPRSIAAATTATVTAACKQGTCQITAQFLSRNRPHKTG